MTPRRLLLVLVLMSLSAGCVRQRLTVTSDPPGALVTLNDVEFGRTPVTRDFTWYGTYDVQIRKEGYKTLDTTGVVIAPWWNWVPLDLIANLLPLTDHQKLHYTLNPSTRPANDSGAVVERAEQLRAKLDEK